MSDIKIESNDTIRVSRSRRCTAIIEEDVTYRIAKADWEAALSESGGDEEEALSELVSSAGSAQRISFNVNVEDTTEEHSCEVYVA